MTTPTQRWSFSSAVLGTGDPRWGDERERNVQLEAYAFAQSLTVYAALLFGAVVAWLGSFWVTLGLLLLVVVFPSIAFRRYCRARNVDVRALIYGRAGRMRIAVTFAITIGALVCMMFGVAHREGLATGLGGILGALAGGTASIIGGVVYARKVQAATETHDDE
ncbi:hypothetical protein [Nocardia sp. NBC_01388]|uniref:hypothetical protein n=1 Tax=Nocardia sp. NBC_01388 TaxID=2903596 RepID=UPI0032488720